MAVSYGYLALLSPAIKRDSTVQPVPQSEIQVSHEINLRIQPDDSYLFDGLTAKEADGWLNNVTFYSELTYNIPLQNFMNERLLADAFVPVATFHKEDANS